MKEGILALFRGFHEHGTFTKSLNTTFLVLIPKKGGVKSLRVLGTLDLLSWWKSLQDFGKVLANRLKRVVGNVVSEA